MTALDVTRFVNSRAMVAITGIIMLVAARVAFQAGEVTYFTYDRGILFESPNLWITNRWLTMAVSTALILATALSWMFIIQLFNPFRALTTLPASFFLAMVTAMPDIMDQLYTGTVMAFAIVVCIPLLWSSFADVGRLRHIFLLFFILSALTMTRYCFAVYIPVFILGCIQMKIMSLRTIIACILGIATPWWIALGIGLIEPPAIRMPDFSQFSLVFDFDGTLNLILVLVTTSVLLVVAWCANFMKVLTLNANLRAFNGSISLIALFTVLAICVDFSNAVAYLPTLMLASSYELAYMFGTSHGDRRYIGITALMLVYIGFFVLRIAI